MNTFCFVISLIFLTVSLIFIRKRTLEIKYSLFWITISIIMMILSIHVSFTEWLAKFVGIIYAPAFLFLIGIIFNFILIFYLMLLISNIQKKLTRVIQENAILKEEISEKNNSPQM